MITMNLPVLQLQDVPDGITPHDIRMGTPFTIFIKEIKGENFRNFFVIFSKYGRPSPHEMKCRKEYVQELYQGMVS
ncbi:MAG: hypothetical protein PHS73_00250 [Candidatus Peribacteraceae bacterium]|nr:hypothetical protein [Candidatus Peribacteraceae bacterium]